MVTLKNEKLIAEISELGAELKSLKKDGSEYMWQGDPNVWSGTSPVLFPMLCSLRDDKYILNGREYKLEKHGFARHKTFLVESATETSAVFLLKDDEDTLKSFPFKFEFRVVFTLNEDSLKVEYRVKNLSEDTMYFSVGAHEAYMTPEGIEDYDIIFPEKEIFDSVLLNGGLLQKNNMLIAKNTNILPLYDKYFVLDTLIFRNLKSKSCILRNRKTERSVKIEFPDCDYLAVWHKMSAGYICIEPWSGLPDREDSNYDITEKEGIITLSGKGEYTNSHTVTIL